MGSYNWFGLYLNEVGHEFSLDLSPNLLQRRRQILGRFVSDFMLNHLVFGPLNIAAWRGVWGYAYYYFTLVSHVQACKLKFRLRELIFSLCSAAALAV